jgi:redox-sensitive bicupin YhaK (pirin superfamily)
MKKKLITSNNAHASRSMGPNVRQVIPSAIEHIDPFVFLDHFGPIEKQPDGQGIPPHPHAGIATITYLFSGSNRHQDSLGNDAFVHAGDIAWMQAGKGIVHAEGMNENRKEIETVEGLQFWISLPAKDKFIDPAFYYHPCDQLPEFTLNETRVKVVCGELLGYTSPVKSLSPSYIFEFKLPKNNTIEIPIKNGDTAGLYVIKGHLTAENESILRTYMTSFSVQGDLIEVKAIEDTHFILFGGTPLNEPIVGYASYVMNSQDQIRKVIMDYQLGKMGTVKIESIKK